MGKTEKEKIKNFKNELSKVASNDEFDNPWEDSKKRENLEKFLLRSNIKYILIGEAPGRRGCLKCGVPFCDDNTLKEIINKPNVVGEESKETSAQRIYMAFKNDFVAWNVFPFHPKGKNGKNRTPNTKELKLGQKYLEDFLEIFKNSGAKIILVGRKAEKAFKKLVSGKGYTYIIHPSPKADRWRDKEGYGSGDAGWDKYIDKLKKKFSKN